MYLSKIELFGFKSFAHKVKITFDKGLTAIVGPNGCGKTNVVDAIRWVLGEQKTSLLRSSKMESIIFNGSRKLKPLSMSEVSITIENTRNILPTEYTEVTVTRRVYRNGESDYLLNQVPCRLKDILELFADTGMGSDAYSVIELKMIEEIINNKSDERLKLFEEAAGITRYKHRRKQTFKQLEATKRDLERVDDVLAEVTKKVRNLKSQVRKAKQYHEITTSFRDLDLTLSKIHFDECVDKLHPLKTDISEQERVVQELTTKIASNDSILQESELEQLEQERMLSEAQTVLNEKNKELHALEKNILQAQEQEKNLRHNTTRIAEAITEKKQQAVARENEKKQLTDQLQPLEKHFSIIENELLALKKEQNTLQRALVQSRDDVEKERARISGLQKAASHLHVTRQRLETTIDHLKSSMASMDQHRNELLKNINDALPAREKLNERIEKQKTVISSVNKEFLSLKKLQQDLDEQLEAKKELLLKLRSRRDQLRNRILLANSILDDYEGLPEGISWLENGKQGKTGHGCLSDLLSLEDVHRKAINAVLGESLGYYVCSSLPEAKTGIRSLAEAGKGKVTFLVLDMLKTPEMDASPAINGTIKINSILSFPKSLSKAITALTEGCYLVDTFSTAETLASENPGYTFVTPDGEKIGGNGVVFGGSSAENEGLRLGKKAERDQLRAEEHDLEKELGLEESRLQSIRNKLQNIKLGEKEKQRTTLEREIGEISNNLARMDIEHASQQQDIERTEKESANTEKRLKTTEAELEKLLPEIAAHKETNTALHTSLENARKELEKNERNLSLHSQKVQRHVNKHKDSVLELEKLRLRIQSCEQNRSSLEREIEKMQKEIEQTDNALVATAAKIQTHRNELEACLASSGAEQQKLNEMETRYNECKIANQEKRNSLRELRRKHEVEQQIHDELRRSAAEIEKSIDSIFTSVETRYNCSIDAIDIDAPDNFNRENAQKQLDEIRNRIERFGAVNELALEEYETEQERLDFLTEQKEDLIGAETQLRTTIEEINKTALKKFDETFNAVRSNFVRIFRELFEETDEADLLITSEEDPLEAHIEIVAKPRGKKPLSIEQLSGGEKALTALALLFSIYLVKPSPFCILDEVDAPLDDANIERFIKLLKKFENNTQFIIVTHNKNTMASSQALFGVTMEEEGVSRLIPVTLGKTRSESPTPADV
ncbi:MAG: chromosome segregation protein SMC [Chlorobium sp.]|nr:chromosome segregation protein SMC [Chlorobium sp.]MCW8819169.1 chromosome segregation protein SMC [Ignavibacteriaceae bacterium]